MKALFIGGTGTISTAIVERLAEEPGWEVWLLNRGNRSQVIPEGVHQILADIGDEAAVLEKLGDRYFDVVCIYRLYGAAGGAGSPPVPGQDRAVYLYQLRLRVS